MKKFSGICLSIMPLLASNPPTTPYNPAEYLTPAAAATRHVVQQPLVTVPPATRALAQPPVQAPVAAAVPAPLAATPFVMAMSAEDLATSCAKSLLSGEKISRSIMQRLENEPLDIITMIFDKIRISGQSYFHLPNKIPSFFQKFVIHQGSLDVPEVRQFIEKLAPTPHITEHLEGYFGHYYSIRSAFSGGIDFSTDALETHIIHELQSKISEYMMFDDAVR
ncbi:MAG: hypothetical protein Q8K36_03105, partial [Alphaproteobacteria bacterium]|nr:hypothetical protein [Alphaproteobacteria bacterium]